jgi:hypothetical protein
MRVSHLCGLGLTRPCHERAFHLLPNAPNDVAADVQLTGNFQDAFAQAQLSLNAPFHCVIDPRPTKLLDLCELAYTRLPDHAAPRQGHRRPENISLPAAVVVFGCYFGPRTQRKLASY